MYSRPAAGKESRRGPVLYRQDVLSERIVKIIQKRGKNLVITHSLLFVKSMLTFNRESPM